VRKWFPFDEKSLHKCDHTIEQKRPPGKSLSQRIHVEHLRCRMRRSWQSPLQSYNSDEVEANHAIVNAQTSSLRKLLFTTTLSILTSTNLGKWWHWELPRSLLSARQSFSRQTVGPSAERDSRL
jgi:hypothetical protein